MNNKNIISNKFDLNWSTTFSYNNHLRVQILPLALYEWKWQKRHIRINYFDSFWTFSIWDCVSLMKELSVVIWTSVMEFRLGVWVVNGNSDSWLAFSKFLTTILRSFSNRACFKYKNIVLKVLTYVLKRHCAQMMIVRIS